MKEIKRTNMERSPGADPAVTMLLRAAYAPPEEEFWGGLEKKIMERLQDAPGTAWWSVFSEWRTAGVIAATIALLVTGATIMREQALADASRQLAAGAAYFNSEGLPEGIPVTITIKSRDSIPANLPERFLNPFQP